MKKYFGLLLILLSMAGCGGGGGGASTSTGPTYTVTFTTDGHGTIIAGSASQSVAANGSTSAVTAGPSTGYHFLNWTDATSGAVVGTANTLTLTGITSSRTIKANFELDTTGTYNVTFLSSTGGTVSGQTPQTTVNGSTSEVTAVPATGYYFVNWTDTNASGSVVSTSNPLTLTGLTAAQTVYANFAAGALDTLYQLVATLPSTPVDVTFQNGQSLDTTHSEFLVTANVANVANLPGGVNYTLHIVALDAQGNKIKQYTSIQDSTGSDEMLISGNSATAQGTAVVLRATASSINRWAIASITIN